MDAPSTNENSSSKSAPQSSSLWDVVGLVVPAIAVAPFLLFVVDGANWDINSAIAIVAVVALVLLALKRAVRCGRIHSQRRHQLHLAAVGIGTLLFCWATWVFYPPLAVASGLLLFFAWLCGRYRNPWGEIAGWCFALASLIGFPFALLPGITDWMAYLLGGTVGGMLDFMQFPNLTVGTLFESTGLQFSILDIMGGVGSLTLLVLITFVILVFRRDSLLCGILAIFAVPFWLFLSLVIRILVIVFAEHWMDRDLSNGLDFQVLSGATFALACLLSWIGVCVLGQMTKPMIAKEDDFGPALEHFNNFLRWPQSIPPRSDARVQPSSQTISEGIPFSASGFQVPHIVFGVPVGLCGLMAIAVVLGGSAVPSWRQDSDWVSSTRSRIENAELPADRDELRRIALTDEQSVGPLFAAYLADNRTVEFSVFAPQFGWVDPCRIYEEMGWSVRGEFKSDTDWPHYAVALEMDSGVYRYVFASCANRNLEPLDLIPVYSNGGETAVPSPNVLGLLSGEPRTVNIPNVRFQMSCEAPTPLGRVEIAELEAVFLEIRDSIVKQAN